MVVVRSGTESPRGRRTGTAARERRRPMEMAGGRRKAVELSTVGSGYARRSTEMGCWILRILLGLLKVVKKKRK